MATPDVGDLNKGFTEQYWSEILGFFVAFKLAFSFIFFKFGYRWFWGYNASTDAYVKIDAGSATPDKVFSFLFSNFYIPHKLSPYF